MISADDVYNNNKETQTASKFEWKEEKTKETAWNI